MTGESEAQWQRAEERAACDLESLAAELRDGGTVSGVLVVYLEDGVLQPPLIEARDEKNRRKLEKILNPNRRFK